MTHVRVWKFRPRAGREAEFAAAYSGGGRWAKLFARGNGYLGTALLRPVDGAEGWWLTLDRWKSAVDFDAFQKIFSDDYRALDSALEGVAGDEEFVGAFEEDEQ